MRSILAVLAGLAAAGAFVAPAAAAVPNRQPAAYANQTANWFGYDQGSLEHGGTLFTSIGGEWTVPAATQHAPGEAENSAVWIGIGGGCIDAACAQKDTTLIQTGTSSNVDLGGAAAYEAWWELIPDSAQPIDGMTVAPGDRMRAAIAEVEANRWTITLRDLTRNEAFTTTVRYASTHLTAEWIVEAPLVFGVGIGAGGLPNLADPAFGSATVNGSPANLQVSEQIQMIDASSNVVGTPSAPNASQDGFAACSWSPTC